MELIKGFDSNYRYILVAARRARQLQNGANPMVETDSKKTCHIAQQEVHAAKVKWTIPPAKKTAVEVASETLDNAMVAAKAEEK